MTEAAITPLAAIAVALIAAVASIAAAIITSRTRRENTEQHGTSVEALARVEGAVGGLVGQFGELREDVQRIGERTAVLEAYLGDHVVGTRDRSLTITKEVHHG